jgi:hypothetical protein
VTSAVAHDDCEVAVIGAGPYGLAAAAHLKAAKIDTRVFGRPMSFWREHMPSGMRLRSPWIASHIADPERQFSLDVYAGEHAIARQDQLPLDEFVRYGDWFQRQACPGLDARPVRRVEQSGQGFRLVLDDGEAVAARRVVVAMGLANQELRPSQFEGIAPDLVSHTCAHARLDKWPGRRVAVIGRGQSACESAALLRAAGSEVDLICRGEVHWIGTAPGEASASPDRRRGLRELLQSPSAVGPFPWSWLNELPGLERRLPDGWRAWINARSLRAAATRWVMPGFADVRVLAGQNIKHVRPQGHQVAITLDDGPRVYDHILLGTGYRIDIAKLGILPPELTDAIACRQGLPMLAAGFESSVPGLHFVGASSIASYGPLMRFIAGAGFAARDVTRAALADRRSPQLRPLDPRAGTFGVGAARRIPQV